MAECRSCGLEVEPSNGACPECGAAADAGTESFPAVMPGGAGDHSHEGSASQPVLIVEKGPEVGERFEIERAVLVVGRDPECDIFLNDVTVSRNHAEIHLEDGIVHVHDAGSLNGTYINGIRVDEAALQHGDSVQVGRFQMVFLAGGTG